MKFSHFFIQRPIFAGVLSLIIFIVGAISLWRLPISEYPEVVPPTVVVRAVYPGANPKTIAETVASPLEQTINGLRSAHQSPRRWVDRTAAFRREAIRSQHTVIHQNGSEAMRKHSAAEPQPMRSAAL